MLSMYINNYTVGNFWSKISSECPVRYRGMAHLPFLMVKYEQLIIKVLLRLQIEDISPVYQQVLHNVMMKCFKVIKIQAF